MTNLKTPSEKYGLSVGDILKHKMHPKGIRYLIIGNAGRVARILVLRFEPATSWLRKNGTKKTLLYTSTFATSAGGIIYCDWTWLSVNMAHIGDTDDIGQPNDPLVG
jgi:hypothetical protein